MSSNNFEGAKKQYTSIILFVLVFFTVILAIVVGMGVKNTTNLRSILFSSVRSHLISVSIAAREMLNVDEFVHYNDPSTVMLPSHQVTLRNLRRLAKLVGVKHIYVLKYLEDGYVSVFDTDEQNTSIFTPYAPARVHMEAFEGRNATSVMNPDGGKSSFNTGAVPIFHNSHVVGVIGVDIEDAYLESSFTMAVWNAVMLIAILTLTMLGVLYLIFRLLRQVKALQNKLERQALYDTVTGLPNRQCLMEHLTKLVLSKNAEPFALFFIDLDNFKTVNDGAGHDAGDELLRQIAKYLETSSFNAKSFRPTAGRLNIAARVGGDEFIQVVTGVDSVEKASELALQLLAGFDHAEPSRFVKKYHVGLSIGVALFPYHSKDFHVLIKYADIAMYHAKRRGKNQHCVYEDEMGKENSLGM